MGKVMTAGFLTDTVNGITINAAFPCGGKNYTSLTSRKVEYLVAHYIGNAEDTAKNNARYFRTGSRGASAHFFVDESNIYQSVRLKDRAWHCGGAAKYYHTKCRNNNSIAVEMCCSGNFHISDKTKENASHLFARLCEIINIGPDDVDRYVLRRWDITRKECPRQMIGANNAEWTAFKERIKAILRGDKKPLVLIAQEVLNGKWGNGDTRRLKLSAAGYDPKEVQALVNELTKGTYRVMITASALNVRKEPGTNYGKLDTLMHGTIVTADEVREDPGASAWGRVSTGWISLDYTAEV